jgi:hypothetical protein
MKILSTHEIHGLNKPNHIIEIPFELEKRVLEFLQLTKLLFRSIDMNKEGLIPDSDVDKLRMRFYKEEIILSKIVPMVDSTEKFHNFFWELYED